MLTKKQINRLHEERNRIFALVQELRMIGTAEDASWWLPCFGIAASQLEEACYMIDRGILEGSAKDERQADQAETQGRQSIPV